MRVLVAYATAHGSTRDIAGRIATGLRDAGVETDLRPVEEAGDPGCYEALVLGSAIHGGAWLPEAAAYATRCLAGPGGRPVWLFSVSTVGATTSAFPPGVARGFRRARKEAAEVGELRCAVNVRDHRDFAGVVAREDWPAPGRAFFRAVRGRYGDHRDWADIDAWAAGIARALRVPGGTEPAPEVRR